jgi:ribosomal silencing factor RsfS
MSLTEKLLKEIEGLSEERKQEVIDFVEFLKTKSKKEVEAMMDSIIEENKEALEELSH